MYEYEEGTDYVLTAPRCRASWKVIQGAAVLTKSKRIKRGEKLTGIPDDQIARLVEMGHAVPEDKYDPEEMRRVSAARRLAMNQAAAADARSAVENAKASSGFPLVGLADADSHEVDGIKVEDIDDVKQPDDGPVSDDDLTSVPADDNGDQTGVQDEYTTMSYPDLQKAAKDKTGNGGGSGDELRARLREHDAQ